MLVKQDTINKIREYFGLNLYETKVWLALLSRGAASAGELAQISNVPRSRCYDILESLEKKGFAIVKLGKPIKFIGVKPQIVLERVKNNIKNEAEERINRVASINNTQEFREIEEIYKKGFAPVVKEDVFSYIKGRANISSYLKESTKNASKEVIICDEAENIYPRINLFKKTIDEIKKPGIRLKIILFGNEKIINKIEEILGFEIKRTKIKAKFFVIDEKEVIFYNQTEKSTNKEEATIVLNSEFFARAIIKLLNSKEKY